jgi:hypothetical protein
VADTSLRGAANRVSAECESVCVALGSKYRKQLSHGRRLPGGFQEDTGQGASPTLRWVDEITRNARIRAKLPTVPSRVWVPQTAWWSSEDSNWVPATQSRELLSLFAPASWRRKARILRKTPLSCVAALARHDRDISGNAKCLLVRLASFKASRGLIPVSTSAILALVARLVEDLAPHTA